VRGVRRFAATEGLEIRAGHGREARSTHAKHHFLQRSGPVNQVWAPLRLDCPVDEILDEMRFAAGRLSHFEVVDALRGSSIYSSL
jgi:hypothetical protein